MTSLGVVDNCIEGGHIGALSRRRSGWSGNYVEWPAGVQCHYCKHYGHFKRGCPKKKRNSIASVVSPSVGATLGPAFKTALAQTSSSIKQHPDPFGKNEIDDGGSRGNAAAENGRRKDGTIRDQVYLYSYEGIRQKHCSHNTRKLHPAVRTYCMARIEATREHEDVCCSTRSHW